MVIVAMASMDSDAERMAFYGGLASKSSDPVDELKALLMPIPGTRKAVFERLQLLPFMKVEAAGVLYDKVTYKGEEFFELQKNIFHGRLKYGHFDVGGRYYLSITTLYKGCKSDELEFEKLNKADDIERFWRSFFRKVKIIRSLARNSFVSDIRRLNLVQLYRDMAMYRGANTLCEEAEGWTMFQ